MNDELRALYQDLILDHARHPRNTGRLEPPALQAVGYNPLCGDKIALSVLVGEGERISDLRFEGQGCAISTASASLMSEAMRGKTISEARRLFDDFHQLMTSRAAAGSPAGAAAELDQLGDLRALEGVREYPVRIKCATLAWHALRSALLGKQATVSTEGGR